MGCLTKEVTTRYMIAYMLSWFFLAHFFGMTTTIRAQDVTDMVLIPAGSFIKGGFDPIVSDSNITLGFDSTSVDSVCYLRAFYIDKYEVTNEEFTDFLNSGYGDFYHPNMHIREIPGEQLFEAYPGYADHPVVYVNWYAASAYASWSGKRLPSEEEWEKAARGTSSDNGTFQGIGIGHPFPWGIDFPGPRRANFLGSTPGDKPGTTEVGFYDGTYHEGTETLQAMSPYGLYDMAGNVWEWSMTHRITTSLDEGSTFIDTMYVIRGGGWRDPTINIKVDVDPVEVPEARASDLGFRCARDVPAPSVSEERGNTP